MTTDPYTEAIQAGAAALVKPYRDPDTVEAFVDTFPTIASARVIEAALPHLRASILAEQAGPGPCPAVADVPYHPVGAPEFERALKALCDLRAGHAGQHEVVDSTWGTCRWSDPFPGCLSELWEYTGEQQGHLRCERTFMHGGYCINGFYVWDDQLNQVLPREELNTDLTEQWPELANRCAKPKPGSAGVVCWKMPQHADAHDNGAYRWNDCGEEVPGEE
jgi:hypothetical protein